MDDNRKEVVSLRHVYHNEANWSVAMLGGAEVTAVVRRMPYAERVLPNDNLFMAL